MVERAKSSKPRESKSVGKARKTQAPPAASKPRGDKPARKADSVARDLLRRITKGELQLGAVLPKEAELATDYGVNRGVIREAIKLLEVHRRVIARQRIEQGHHPFDHLDGRCDCFLLHENGQP